jgi:alkylhydroperoxidase family enzyme
MLNRFLHGQIRKFERNFDYDMSYGHEMLDISRKAFLSFAKINAMSGYCEDAPPALYHAAKITAMLNEDCGPCTQLVTRMAESAGVEPAVLRAVLAGDAANMSEQARLGWRYATAVLAHDPEADSLRVQIEQQWGPRAVVSLALAIASARVYPTLKYALGHGQSCSRVRAGGVDVVPRKPGVQAEPALA